MWVILESLPAVCCHSPYILLVTGSYFKISLSPLSCCTCFRHMACFMLFPVIRPGLLLPLTGQNFPWHLRPPSWQRMKGKVIAFPRSRLLHGLKALPHSVSGSSAQVLSSGYVVGSFSASVCVAYIICSMLQAAHCSNHLPCYWGGWPGPPSCLSWCEMGESLAKPPSSFLGGAYETHRSVYCSSSVSIHDRCLLHHLHDITCMAMGSLLS